VPIADICHLIDHLVRSQKECFGDGEAERLLFLAHGRPIDGIAVRSNVFDLESDDIAASNLLSMARLNIARSRVRCSIWSLVRIAQTCFCRSGGLAPVSFPLFQGIRFGVGSSELALPCMAVLLGYKGGRACLARTGAEIVSAFGGEAGIDRFLCEMHRSSAQSGHCPALALNRSVAIDPKRTLALIKF
jgi:hypothetical protein